MVLGISNRGCSFFQVLYTSIKLWVQMPYLNSTFPKTMGTIVPTVPTLSQPLICTLISISGPILCRMQISQINQKYMIITIHNWFQINVHFLVTKNKQAVKMAPLAIMIDDKQHFSSWKIYFSMNINHILINFFVQTQKEFDKPRLC